MQDKKNKHVMEFLLSRRSHSALSLTPPAPGKAELDRILTAAARTPDHGKLVPWRFIILEHPVMAKVAERLLEIGKDKGVDSDKLGKNVKIFLNAPLIVVIVFSPRPIERIPLIEQQLSCGAVCLAMLNAAHADGWGANWLTGWMAYDKKFLIEVLGLSEAEFVAGFIHIGTKTMVPMQRERPKIDSITSRLEV